MNAEYQRQWRKKNPDKIKAYQKRHSQLESVKAYRKSYSKKWRELNKEKIKSYYLEYYSKNKGKYFERAWKRIHRRRALKYSGKSEYFTKEQIYNRFGGICIVCDERIDLDIKYPHTMAFTIHHLIPLSKGGDDIISNIAPAHASCNQSVGSKIPIAIRPVVLYV